MSDIEQISHGTELVGRLWKVPFRQCYAHTFWAMIRYAVWCHVVLRIYPHAYDQGGPAPCAADAAGLGGAP